MPNKSNLVLQFLFTLKLKHKKKNTPLPMLVFYTFKLQAYKTKKTEDSHNFQHSTPWPHDFEFKTNKEERHIHSHNFNRTPLTLLFFKYSCYNTKKQKKTKLKHPWLCCYSNSHVAKPKNKKDKLTKSKQHGKNNMQTKINMYKCFNITSNITPQWWSYNTWIKQKRTTNQQKTWSFRRSKIVSPICISFHHKTFYNLYEPQIHKTQSFLKKNN
jgi:hypothetical protein